MRIEIDRRVLEEGLLRVARAVASKSTMPVLSNVLLSMEGDWLGIGATNLEISMETRARARGEAGKITAPAKRLIEICRDAPYDTIVIEGKDNGRAKIAAGRAKYEIPIIPAEDFPKIETDPGEDGATVDGFSLLWALNKVIRVVPSGDDVYGVPGVYLHRVESGIRFVATDGHRLALATVDVGKLGGMEIGEKGAIIPKDAASALMHLLEGVKEAKMSLSERRVFIETRETRLSSLLIDVEFPDYETIIADNFSCEVILPREETLSALKRILPFASAGTFPVMLSLTAEGMGMECKSDDSGSASDCIRFNRSGEPDFTVAYNAKYMRDALIALGSEKVRFAWVDGFRGGHFFDPENEGALHLIMPLVV